MHPARIVGTPELYYKRWPKFYNNECYQILADFTAHPEVSKDNAEEVIEEKKESNPDYKNRKRKVCVCVLILNSVSMFYQCNGKNGSTKITLTSNLNSLSGESHDCNFYLT